MRAVRVAFLLMVAACAKPLADDFDTTDGGKEAGSGGDSSARSDGGGGDSGGCAKCGGTSCVDFQTDSNNCGSCGNACPSGSCCQGRCTDTTSDIANCGACGTSCPNNQSCCSASCTDTSSDPAHCGACGASCNGTCMNGTCMTKCTVDLGSCAHSPCVTGVALGPYCDPDGCNFLICNLLDPTCCSSQWSAQCVQYAILFCGEMCGGC